MAKDEDAHYPCPACGSTLYGWTGSRDPLEGERIVYDRCESCGLVVTRDERPPDVELELATLQREGPELVAPNRESFQGGIGAAGWAGMEPELRRRLHLGPESARLLLNKQGTAVGATRTPFSGASYLQMLQTLINAFTYRTNFYRNARAGRLRPRGTGGRLLYALDWIVTVMVSIPMAIVALPLELVGSLLGRGGIMRLQLPDGGEPGSDPRDRR